MKGPVTVNPLSRRIFRRVPEGGTHTEAAVPVPSECRKGSVLCSEAKVRCPLDEKMTLEGKLVLPAGAGGVVLVTTTGKDPLQLGLVVRALQREGWGTLLVPLLTVEEEALDLRARHLRFNVDLLSERVVCITDWAAQHARLPLACWGSGTSAAASIVAAERRQHLIVSLVSYAGRPDLAEEALARLRVPLLFIVRQDDIRLIDIHRDVMRRIPGRGRMTVLEAGARLPGEQRLARSVARLSSGWYFRHFEAGPKKIAGPAVVA